MESVELYFLNYKFNIFLEKFLKIDFLKFWKGFLKKNSDFSINDEWDIYFIKDNYNKTEIFFKDKKIYHHQNSVCQLTELNNLLREIIVKVSAMDGIIWLHCSGFQYKNKTFLIVGNKGDGKTTFLLNAIKYGAKYIGNDQLPLFEYKNEIYTYLWRPDIKISIDYAQENKIITSKECENGEKVLYLVNNRIPYDFIDRDKMSKRLNKKIDLPERNIKIDLIKNFKSKIDYLIFLDNKQIIKKYNKKIIDKIKDDQETILSYKLENMQKYMPYWNKRITKIQMSEKAYKINNYILFVLNNQSKKFICGNRMDFDFVWKTINNFLEDIYDEK